jgi:hypothetical protein
MHLANIFSLSASKCTLPGVLNGGSVENQPLDAFRTVQRTGETP